MSQATVQVVAALGAACDDGAHSSSVRSRTRPDVLADAGVARTWCEWGTKLRGEHNLRVTRKYYEIHAINSDRVRGR